jgi:hypothetical protein
MSTETQTSIQSDKIRVTLSGNVETGEGYVTRKGGEEIERLWKTGLLGADIIKDWKDDIDFAYTGSRAVMAAEFAREKTPTPLTPENVAGALYDAEIWPSFDNAMAFIEAFFANDYDLVKGEALADSVAKIGSSELFKMRAIDEIKRKWADLMYEPCRPKCDVSEICSIENLREMALIELALDVKFNFDSDASLDSD